MQAYRVTEFNSQSPEKIATACEAIRGIVAKAGAEMIDIVMMEGGKGLVIARYETQAAMEAATKYNQQGFAALVIDGVVEATSISSRSGDKIFEF